MFSTAWRASRWMLWIKSAISFVDCVDFFRQLADLIRNYGKSQPVLAGAGRFDGGVQRQKVGLLRQVVDDFNNFPDVVARWPKTLMISAED